MSEVHEFYMQRCLELARQGRGNTHPNPMVGAVVLDAAGQVVGEGFHAAYGGPHAEVVAFRQAGDAARGGTLYVSLEPCSHTGKTPPCTEAVLTAGVQAVVCGMTDPNPRVAGSGIDTLRAHGLTVRSGVLEAECQRLNEAFCHFIQTRRPFVVLKMALSLDGKIATRNGDSQWITGPGARRWVHRLRAESDAVLTTAETILADNCRLTVRDTPRLGKPPVRIVLDRQARLEPDRWALFQAIEQDGPVWIVTSRGQNHTPSLQRAIASGARVIEVPDNGQGLVLEAVLDTLGEAGITQLLVEAGGRLAGSLLNQRLINKLWLIYGNQILGDPAAKPGFLGDPLFRLSDAPRMRIASSFTAGDNTFLEAYPL